MTLTQPLLHIGINAQYMIEGLTSLRQQGAPTVTLAFNTPGDPITCVSQQQTFVVMPIRL